MTSSHVCWQDEVGLYIGDDLDHHDRVGRSTNGNTWTKRSLLSHFACKEVDNLLRQGAGILTSLSDQRDSLKVRPSTWTHVKRPPRVA